MHARLRVFTPFRAVSLAVLLVLSALGGAALGMAPLQEGCPGAGQATAKNDVDIYDSPVKPRKVVGMMNGGSSAPFLQRHPDGWCKLGNLKWFDGTTGPGWVAEDHVTMSGAPKANDKLEKCTKGCENECLGTRGMPWDQCVQQCLLSTRC